MSKYVRLTRTEGGSILLRKDTILIIESVNNGHGYSQTWVNIEGNHNLLVEESVETILNQIKDNYQKGLIQDMEYNDVVSFHLAHSNRVVVDWDILP